MRTIQQLCSLFAVINIDFVFVKFSKLFVTFVFVKYSKLFFIFVIF